MKLSSALFRGSSNIPLLLLPPGLSLSRRRVVVRRLSPDIFSEQERERERDCAPLYSWRRGGVGSVAARLTSLRYRRRVIRVVARAETGTAGDARYLSRLSRHTRRTRALSTSRAPLINLASRLFLRRADIIAENQFSRLSIYPGARTSRARPGFALHCIVRGLCLCLESGSSRTLARSFPRQTEFNYESCVLIRRNEMPILTLKYPPSEYTNDD